MSYDSNWQYRAKITIDNTKVSADLTDFPIYLNLADFGSSHGIWSNVKSDGADIRITKSDGSSEVAREIVSIDTTAKTGEIHFKASGTLSSSSDTDYYIYYGNSSASNYSQSDTYGQHNVWDSNFKAVWHMEEEAENITDSASNEIDESDPAGSSGTSVSAKMGNGIDLNGSSNFIVFESGVTNASPTSALQFELWFNADVIGSDVLLYCRGDSTNKGYGFWFWNSNLRAQIGSNGWTNLTYPLSSLSTNTWYHVIGNWDGSTYRMYLNGSQVDSGAYTGSQTYFGSQLLIGKRNTGDYFDGTIDEVRIHDTARSADWIATQYNNQNSSSTFYTISEEEANPGGGVVFIPEIKIF